MCVSHKEERKIILHITYRLTHTPEAPLGELVRFFNLFAIYSRPSLKAIYILQEANNIRLR